MSDPQNTKFIISQLRKNIFTLIEILLIQANDSKIEWEIFKYCFLLTEL